MPAHELPSLPSLPPLALPTYRDSSLAPPPPLSPGRSSFHLQQSPALSLADSFSTAFTSASPTHDPPDIGLLGPATLSPSQSLRKSVSVDSFAHYNRDVPNARLNEPTELNRSPMYSIPGHFPQPPIPILVPRQRGESMTSSQYDLESSFPPDPDVDRYDPLSLSALGHPRRLSLKTQEPSKASLRGGDLTLPSRTPASPTGITTSHSDLGALPTISSTTSLQSSSRKALTSLPAGRLRSGSLGYNFPSSANSKRTTPFPTQNRSSVSNSSKEIVLAIVGTAGCGKSTLIRKGLSGYGLSEPMVVSESLGSDQTRYVRRTGTVLLDDQSSSAGSSEIVEIIEVDIQSTTNDLLNWPHSLPPLDGIIICYDASSQNSFQPVEGFLKGYRNLLVPVMVLGCKSDRHHEIDSTKVMAMLKHHDTGLIEVSSANEIGKARMKQSFAYLLKAILRQRGDNPVMKDRNPASPDFLNKGAATGDSWTHSPTSPTSGPSFSASSSMSLATDISDSSEPSASTPTAESASPISPNGHLVSMDLVHTLEMSAASRDSHQDTDVHDSDADHHHDSEHSSALPEGRPRREEKKAKKEPRPSQWADLDDLLDKLLFLAVSGDDPTFATHFLLTYRRFTTPRSVLLAMQKRMRQLDNPSGDPMFACFAQMRICNLLETWIHDYPHDFAVKGTAGALNALIKSIISKTHLLHYGSDFLPFLEQLPSLVDEDTTWALKVEADADSDDYTPEDEDEDEIKVDETHSAETETTSGETSTSSPPPKVSPPSRERKASLPLSKVLSTHTNNDHHSIAFYNQHPKHYIRDLVKLAQDVLKIDSDEIAQEITRQGVKRFMIIKPRDWLYFTFVTKKHPDEPITMFNLMSNHLADWVVSLILCHESPRQRARQIEKFVEIGMKLRNMNNYSALRAFVAGINNANDDLTMEQFKSKSPDHDKNLRSWDVLLQQVRAHRSYRLALRNSKGACIPAMEVHISDLIKSHEGNEDTNPAYPNKIHWGKFNMIGRFITTTIQCQNQCRNSNDYDFMERPNVAELLNRRPVMTIEMQKSRLKAQEDYEDIPPAIQQTHTPPANVTGMRRMFFW